MTYEERIDFDANLNAPLGNPTTQTPAAPTEDQIEAEGAAFMTAMMQHQQVTGG